MYEHFFFTNTVVRVKVGGWYKEQNWILFLGVRNMFRPRFHGIHYAQGLTGKLPEI